MPGPEPPSATLARDHRELDAFFTAAAGALARGDAAAAHEALDRAWMRLAVHIRAEHKVLFPAVLEAHPDLADRILRLREDHDVFMVALARLVAASKGPSPELPALADELERVVTRLQAHNRLEEAEVYPRAGADPELQDRLHAELAFLPERYRA
ncbi:MAG TPA: hemerythrin domain-containing protein [Holophagaceae bacterium]|nr:hemerythrin domain-containing protein [Holophagaceae bacterium]